MPKVETNFEAGFLGGVEPWICYTETVGVHYKKA